MIAQKGMKWCEGLRLIWGVGGSIDAEEQNGRHYFYVRVSFPQASGWWPRTTETSSVDEAREWIEKQEDDYRAHFPATEASLQTKAPAMTTDEENAIIAQDRLIIATGALEEIRAIGGRAGRIAAETLEGFALADKPARDAIEAQRGEDE